MAIDHVFREILHAELLLGEVIVMRLAVVRMLRGVVLETNQAEESHRFGPITRRRNLSARAIRTKANRRRSSRASARLERATTCDCGVDQITILDSATLGGIGPTSNSR